MNKLDNRDNQRLVAHLMRRAGFGGTCAEIDRLSAMPYHEVVENLVHPEETSWMGEHLIRRFHHEQSAMMASYGPGEYWLYRMVTTKAPLIEKVTLFWHGIFATGYPKVIHGKVLSNQIDMLRRNGMGRLDDLLVELSRDPAMIVWLDNQENHDGAINENYGRELLELFSMGVGNYGEQDIKEASRAFTGWTIGNTEYMVLRSERDSDMPYGRIAWHFEFDERDHDSGTKDFLGERGNFDGADIIRIICEQEATARFIARHMYSFFVEDESPVPSWDHTSPKNPEAMDILVKAYFDSDHSISEMLTTLFNSDFFKSHSVRYKRMKSPAELVAGVLKLTGQLDRPRREIMDHALKMLFMGQHLHNPPSVEGWHEGDEWIETGTILERVNFASEQMGNFSYPGVSQMIDSALISQDNGDTLPQRCLDALGYFEVSENVMDVLRSLNGEENESSDDARQLIRIIAASPEFQKC